LATTDRPLFITTGTPLVSTFTFETDLPEGVWTIRTVQDVNGDPWFVAKDVCEALGISQKAHGHAYKSVKDDERKLYQIQKGSRSQVIVSESGLYKLVMRSDKPVAKPFQDWVTRDVLPAIRKDGMYVLGEEKVATGENQSMNALVSTTGLTGTTITGILTDGLDQPLTMSSREIAELTGKHHHHVCRDIRNMLKDLGLTETKFGSSYRDASGKSNIEYHLPKDLTFTLVSGYSVPLRHKIVTRWQSLEQAERGPVVPQSLPEALRLAADLAEKNAALAIENQKLAPLAKVGDVAVSHKRGVVEIGRKLPSDLKRPTPHSGASV
jgi:prophage antirepressor-like protein